MAIFKGAGVAIVTPMHEDGKVNYEKLEELLEQQGEQQQLLLEELNRNLRELTKGTQKGKLGIFR